MNLRHVKYVTYGCLFLLLIVAIAMAVTGAYGVFTTITILLLIGFGIFDFVCCRCPHCHHHLRLLKGEYCPYCGGDLYAE